MVGPTRAIVFFYGGSWRDGTRTDYAFVGEALAAIGAIAMVADYRLYPEVSYPGFLEDCAAATAFARRWLAQQGYADARLFVAGHSAGAYNAAMLATDSRWLGAQGIRTDSLSGWIGMAGPYNFLPIQTADILPVFNHPHETQDSQPLFHVDQRWQPPALLLTGEHDAYVDVRRNTLSLAERLMKYRHPVALKVYPRLDHKTLVAALAPPLQFLGPVLSDVADFISKA
ncbi:esterase/lipase/thioesterase family protein [Ralstonia sp. NT80]|nr:esterase/lipase/thioesterase family protein [Ralstonia sp. NT80]